MENKRWKASFTEAKIFPKKISPEEVCISKQATVQIYRIELGGEINGTSHPLLHRDSFNLERHSSHRKRKRKLSSPTRHSAQEDAVTLAEAEAMANPFPVHHSMAAALLGQTPGQLFHGQGRSSIPWWAGLHEV